MSVVDYALPKLPVLKRKLGLIAQLKGEGLVLGRGGSLGLTAGSDEQSTCSVMYVGNTTN